MSPLEILWTITSALVPALIGVGMSMVGLTPPEFWIARACFIGAATVLCAMTGYWIFKTQRPFVWRLAVAFCISTIVFVGTPQSLLWVGRREAETSPSPDKIREASSPQVSSANGARLHIGQWEFNQPQVGKQFFINMHAVNKGVIAAKKWQHLGQIIISPLPISENIIIGTLGMLRAQLGAIQIKSDGEIQPDQGDTWWSVFGPQLDDDIVSALNSGKYVAYMINVTSYTDDLLKERQHRYTESCIYVRQGVVHLCESGHNRIYTGE